MKRVGVVILPRPTPLDNFTKKKKKSAFAISLQINLPMALISVWGMGKVTFPVITIVLNTFDINKL